MKEVILVAGELWRRGDLFECGTDLGRRARQGSALIREKLHFFQTHFHKFHS